MPRYIVYVKEVWVREVRIDAASIDEAKKKVMHGEGENLSTDFDDAFTEDQWHVREDTRI